MSIMMMQIKNFVATETKDSVRLVEWEEGDKLNGKKDS